MSTFQIKLDGITLTPDVEKKIQSRLQTVISEELSSLKPITDGTVGVPHIFIPIKYPGFIVRGLNPKELTDIERQFNIKM